MPEWLPQSYILEGEYRTTGEGRGEVYIKMVVGDEDHLSHLDVAYEATHPIRWGPMKGKTQNIKHNN